MSGFTKVTVVGTTRKATLVVPANDPIGTHLSDIASLLQEPQDRVNGALTLVTPLGVELELNHALADQAVLDGGVLRLIRARDVPPPPEVTDVTDTVAELHDAHLHPWNSRHRTTLGAIAAAPLSALAVIGFPAAQVWPSAALFVTAIILTIVLGRTRKNAAGIVLIGVAVGSALPLANELATVLPGALPSPAVFVILFLGFIWLALGAAWGLGRRNRAAGIGSATGLAFSLLAITLHLSGIDASWVAAVIGVVGIASIGMLPGIALASSGVATLDDRVIAGALPARDDVAASVYDAYKLFTWLVYALAAPLALAASWLLFSGGLWETLLGAAMAIVVLMRTRIVPLASQAWPLWTAGIGAAIAGIALAPALPDWMRIILVFTGMALILTLTLARPSAQARIRFRGLGDQLETLAAISLIPLLVGIFGIYDFMLAVF